MTQDSSAGSMGFSSSPGLRSKVMSIVGIESWIIICGQILGSIFDSIAWSRVGSYRLRIESSRYCISI